MAHLLTDLSTAALIAAGEANYMEMARYVARSPCMELHDDGDMLRLVAPEFPLPVYASQVLRVRLAPESADSRLGETLAYFGARGLSVVWATDPLTTPADLGQRLAAHGAASSGDRPSMYVDLHCMREDFPAPPGLRIQRVASAALLESYLQVLPDEASARFSRAIMASLGFDEAAPRQHYVAFLGGAPVAHATMFLGGGVVGIYGVATVPGARRQGIGTAITLTLLREARQRGYCVGVLSSTPMALGIYTRIGFREYCRIASHAWQPAGAAG